jgi:hypothetical protein
MKHLLIKDKLWNAWQKAKEMDYSCMASSND